MFLKKKNKSNLKRGISIFEVMAGLVIGLILYGDYNKMQQQSVQNMRAKSIADTMSIAGSAADTYAHMSSDALMMALGDNQTVAVPFNGDTGPVANTISLIASGLIPYNYNPVLPYGQQMAVLMKKIPADTNIPAHIESMVVTYGGSPYGDGMVGSILNQLGGKGGAIMTHTISGVTSSTIQGSYGSWSSPAESWTSNGVVPVKGHVVLHQNNLVGSLSEFMNRFNIGNPEANRMHTNIIMNNNKINRVNTIDGVPGQDLTIGSIATNNNIVAAKNMAICQSQDASCGLTIASDAAILNDGGWTTLYQDRRGLHVNGTQGAATVLDGAVYLNIGSGDENPSGYGARSHHSSGILFNYTDNDSFGAHLYQDSAQFLTLTGSSGFSGLQINPSTVGNATLQMLQTKIYSDGHGLLSFQSPTNGIVAIQHNDGSLADISENAVNLGMSTSITSDGKSYPATQKGDCKPNGRIAANTAGNGATMNCINGKWWNISDPYTNLVYYGNLSGYPGNNSHGTHIMMLTQWRFGGKKDDPFAQAFVNGQQVCLNSYDTGRNYDGAVSTCTFPIPPHGVVTGARGDDYVYVYGLPY